jgi:RHS repeat-associated protein
MRVEKAGGRERAGTRQTAERRDGKHITRTAGSTKPELWFTYGADGQRTSKTVGDPLNGGFREWYVRDAQGNIMAMYKYANNGTSLKVTERPVYGSSRLGSYVRQMELVGEPAVHQWPYTQPMQAPLKRYELTDHLGNVNTVVTGRLLPMLGLGVQYQAEVVSATGYESFGFALPNRSFQSANYGWGYGGKFKDDEVNGSPGSSLDYGARMRDPRVGPWITTDPKVDKYPSFSPYIFAAANPIINIDPNGGENVVYIVLLNPSSTVIKKADAEYAAAITNARFQQLGLNTRVKVFEGQNSFDPRNLDKTDSYVMIGSKQGLLAATDKPGFEEVRRTDNMDAPTLETMGDGKVEESYRDGPGVFVEEKTFSEWSDILGAGKADLLSLVIAHGIGHNSGLLHSSSSDIMKDADGVSRMLRPGMPFGPRGQVAEGNPLYTSPGSFFEFGNNKDYRNKVEESFGTENAKDNYKANEETRGQ